MKILLIASRVPAAEQKGDQVVSFHRAMYLARAHTLEIICFGDHKNPRDLRAKEVLASAGIVVHFISWSPLVAFLHLLLATLDVRMPLQCALAKSGEFRKAVDASLKHFRPDFVYCVMIRVLPNLVHFEGPLIVDMIDSMGLNFARRAMKATIPMQWLLRIESSRAVAFERRVALRSTKSFVVSNIDRSFIGESCVDAIPLGVDTDNFANRNNDASAPVVVFSGNMSYRPNVDAILWFARNCWPEVHSKVRDSRLMIVGSRPVPSIVALGLHDESIEVMGHVPSISSVLKLATVAIAPMQSGSGMQFKILEAMACAVPVITTNLGLGDISAAPEKEEILVADSPKLFSQAVLKLIQDKGLARAIGDNGMRFVRANHNWESLNERFATSCGLAR
jgi:glycosyltransferase involved in cell wall biosynthesis